MARISVKLPRCPFCGEEIQVFRKDYKAHEDTPTTQGYRQARCVNPDCKIRPASYWYPTTTLAVNSFKLYNPDELKEELKEEKACRN